MYSKVYVDLQAQKVKLSYMNVGAPRRQWPSVPNLCLNVEQSKAHTAELAL